MRHPLSHAIAATIAVGFAAPLETHAQSSPADSVKFTGHLERPDQPPMRFIGPRQVSPPPSCEFLTVNGFTSAQVNVDEDGNNIIDDAANETTIAINPLDPDNIVIGWRQFDSIESNFRQSGVASSHDGGMTWTNRGPLQAGTFGSDPTLDVDADGVFYYVGIDFDEVRLFRSFNGGVDWDPAIQVIDGFRDKEWLTIDKTDGIGRGNLYMTWSNTLNFTRSTDGGENWMTPIETPLRSSVWGTLSVGPDGELYVVDGSFRVARSDDAQNAERAPTFPQVADVSLGGPLVFGDRPNPGGLLGQPWIKTDHSDGPTRGSVYLLCTVNAERGDPHDVMFARSTDGGLTWTAPIRVNDDPIDRDAWQWFGAMDVAPSGRIDAVWYDTRNSLDAVLSEVFYAYSTNAGDTWSPNIQVAPVFNSTIGHPQQDKIGDYIGVISNGAANVAYAATYNGEQDVYFLSIEIDCNENGMHDGDDILAGRSDDCNGNAMPDECEPNEDCNDNGIRDICEQDCNGNGFADECDIRDGTSEDCNDNGVPDECLDIEGDCNENQVPDDCDIRDGTSEDCNENGIPDDCLDIEADCNENRIPDECDIAKGTSQDCNRNARPDECELHHDFFKLLAEDGATLDEFGKSVAIHGVTAIVGAHRADNDDQDAGSAYLFDTSTGQQIAELLPGDGAEGDQFGVSVALSESTAIVGAPFDDDNGADSGATYIFDAFTGQQIAKLLPTDGAADDRFGASVAMSGNTAIIGADGCDDNGTDSGAAYLFDASTGVQIAKLLPGDGTSNDHFGSSVSISGDIAIVGAPSDDDNGPDSGSAYLLDIGTGRQIAKLLPEDGGPSDLFGKSVAISGATAIVGAPGTDDVGSAYFFEASTGRQIARILPIRARPGDRFGTSVAITNVTATVGAPGQNSFGFDAGAAYFFNTSTGRQSAILLPRDGRAGDRFGASVAISGTIAIVGAYLDDDNGMGSGSAFLFDSTGCRPCAREPEWLCDGDVDGDGQVNPVDSGLVQAAFGSTDQADLCQFDIDCDGQINPVDSGIVQSLFGRCEKPRDVCP